MTINGVVYPVSVTQAAIYEGQADYLQFNRILAMSGETRPANYNMCFKDWTIEMTDGGSGVA